MENNIKKIWIEPGCITCGACEFVCPKVFKVTDKSYVQENIEESLKDPETCELIDLAANSCPVQVIKTEK